MGILLVLVLLALPPAASAQSGPLTVLDLPDGNGAWVLRVETSGGFGGRGQGAITLSSAGALACAAVPSCPARLDPEAQRSLTTLIARVPLASPPPRRDLPATGVCNDCITTMLTLRRRDAQGVDQVVGYSWNEVTAASVPGEVLRLRAAAFAVAAVR